MLDPSDSQAAELAALAAWSGGVAAVSHSTARGNLHRHLLNAELLSLQSWTHHPARSLARLIPLRMKERINRATGRTIFDLSFYLQFRPNSVLFGDALVEPLIYYPHPAAGRQRAALVTPHLGPGGAEAVLYDIADALCSKHFETLLLATQSRDDRWLTRWKTRANHAYDLAQVVPSERMIAALCSVISNWRCDYLLVQNSLYGYAAIPHIRKLLPKIKIIDVIHSLDEAWDQIGATADVAPEIDLRVAMSEAVRDRAAGAGNQTRRSCSYAMAWISSDSGLRRSTPIPTETILFAARLDPVKQSSDGRRYCQGTLDAPP